MFSKIYKNDFFLRFKGEKYYKAISVAALLLP